MNAEQWKLILRAENDCIKCMAHMPALDLDQLPQFDALAQLQTLWYAARTVFYD